MFACPDQPHSRKEQGIGVKKKSAQKSAKAARKAKPGQARRASKARKTSKVQPVPPGYRTITAHLVCRNAAGAIDFYGKAFGAKTRMSMPMPDGKVAHAELQIGDSMLMLADESPEMGASAPETIGGTAVHIFMYLKDVDKAFARAVAAGARVEMPPTDMFWGDRYAKLIDPYGHKWSMATHIEDMSPKEMARRGAEFMAKGGPGAG